MEDLRKRSNFDLRPSGLRTIIRGNLQRVDYRPRRAMALTDDNNELAKTVGEVLGISAPDQNIDNQQFRQFIINAIRHSGQEIEDDPTETEINNKILVALQGLKLS